VALSAALAGLLAAPPSGRAAPPAAPAPVRIAPAPAAPALVVPEGALRAVGAEVATVATETGVLRRLPSVGRSARLSGEYDAISWPVFLTAAEAAANPRLRLTHVAAVSVMPEASRLAVSVDDRPVSTFPIATNGSAKVVEIALPAGTLHAGWNLLRIEADQRHRVECSLAATYELWTEIDRARTGLVFADGFTPERRGLADVADLAPDETGRIRIRLVAPVDLEPARLARALRLAQSVALAGGFLDPIVTVERAPGKGPGLDLLIGTRARAGVAAAAALPADVVALIDDPDPARMTLVVPEEAAALDHVVAEFEKAAADPAGSEAGRRARTALGGTPIREGERRRFSELGATSTEFTGRLFRTAFDLRLPPDFHGGDYAKVALKLAGGYAPGLERTSRLTVRVNGRQIAGAPLGATSGEIFAGRRLELPLSAFRAGRNRLEIEAALPAAEDAACDPQIQIDAGKRFLFVDRGEIAFPTFARAARLPDLGATAAGVLSTLSEDLRPGIFVPRPDAATLSAIATATTRMAIAEGRIDVPPITYRLPSSDVPTAWIFGAFPDLPATVGGAVGLETVALREIWNRRPTPERVSDAGPVDPLARRAATLRMAALDETFDTTATGSLQFRPATAGADGDVVDQWRRSMENPWSPAGFLRAVETRLQSGLGPLLGAAPAPTPFAPRASTGIVVAQAASPAGGVWTLATAATAEALLDGTVTLTEGERWSEIAGDVVAWDLGEEKLDTLAGKSRGLFLTSAPTPGNLRLIAAGWVGDHPLAFALALLLACAGIGLSTHRLLPHLGKRS
jgi:hypothetical protein